MTDIAIKVQNLSKCYYIYDNPRDRLKQFVAPRLQRLTWQQPKQYFREFSTCTIRISLFTHIQGYRHSGMDAGIQCHGW